MSKVKVLFIYEEKAPEGGFARAFGINEIEISEDILKKHGKIVSKTMPDIYQTFLSNIEKKAREFFDI